MVLIEGEVRPPEARQRTPRLDEVLSKADLAELDDVIVQNALLSWKRLQDWGDIPEFREVSVCLYVSTQSPPMPRWEPVEIDRAAAHRYAGMPLILIHIRLVPITREGAVTTAVRYQDEVILAGLFRDLPQVLSGRAEIASKIRLKCNRTDPDSWIRLRQPCQTLKYPFVVRRLRKDRANRRSSFAVAYDMK
jgi:hypothetical protein